MNKNILMFFDKYKHSNITYYLPSIENLREKDIKFINEYINIDNKKYSRHTENELKERLIYDFLNKNILKNDKDDNEEFTIIMRSIDILKNYKECFNLAIYTKNYFDDDCREF